MFRRPHYIALSIVLLLVLILLSLPSQTATQLKLALSGFFLPLFGLAGSTQSLSERTGNAILPRRALLEQLDKLQHDLQQLRLRSMQTTQVWEENAHLRELFAWRQQTPWNLRLARVILRDPANWWRTVQIDLGQRDGVTKDMPVLTADGLVGKIWQVGFNTSQVVLVGDPNCHVSALVKTADPKNKDVHGIIDSSSTSVLEPTIVPLKFVEPHSRIEPGQNVLTSGQGGVFPPGIMIGQVIDTRSVGFGVYTEARVKLAANLSDLREVWVKFP